MKGQARLNLRGVWIGDYYETLRWLGCPKKQNKTKKHSGGKSKQLPFLGKKLHRDVFGVTRVKFSQGRVYLSYPFCKVFVFYFRNISKGHIQFCCQFCCAWMNCVFFIITDCIMCVGFSESLLRDCFNHFMLFYFISALLMYTFQVTINVEKTRNGGELPRTFIFRDMYIIWIFIMDTQISLHHGISWDCLIIIF